ncbi:MAG: hypothetical protein U1F33_16770 [Alphaproteobacteria bacterium]
MDGNGPVTIGELAEEGLSVFCWCNDCSHNAIIEAFLLCRRVDAQTTVARLARHLRCGGCGGTNIATRPAWPSLGQVTRHD